MAVKNIPATQEVTCDCCLKVTKKYERATNSKLTFKQDALDFSGIAVADASVVLDLCDNCAYDIGRSINRTCENIREKLKKSK